MRNGPYILVIAPDGYPGKKYRGRYIYEHHLMWWKETGEILKPGEIIHHKNDNKHDNEIENLELMSSSSHGSHHAMVAEITEVTCGYCHHLFKILKRHLKKRMKVTRSGSIYCSRSCQVRQQQRNLKIKNTG